MAFKLEYNFEFQSKMHPSLLTIFFDLFSKIVDNFCWLYFVKMDQNFKIVLMPILKFKTWWDSSQQVCTLLFDNAGFVICQLSFLHREQIHELHYWYNRAFNYHFLMLDLLTAMPWFVLTASLHCRKVQQGWSKIISNLSQSWKL